MRSNGRASKRRGAERIYRDEGDERDQSCFRLFDGKANAGFATECTRGTGPRGFAMVPIQAL
jgi:hypothetical protein